MSDILKQYGNDSRQEQKPRASSGGCTEAKPLSYDKPVGPSGQMKEGPGIGGTNHGQCGTQGKH